MVKDAPAQAVAIYERAVSAWCVRLGGDPHSRRSFAPFVRAGSTRRARVMRRSCARRRPLSMDLWSAFSAFAEDTLKHKSLSLATFERAVRNVTWSIDLWIAYLRAAERHGQSAEQVCTPRNRDCPA